MNRTQQTEPTDATMRASEQDAPPASQCRLCGGRLEHTFVDLGMSPLCESFVPADRANAMEPFYPLHAKVCASCLLVQLEQFVTADDIFTEYAYFSSYSDSWVAHAKNYVDDGDRALRPRENSLVVELASNDGYLLQHVVARGIPALGIEPAANVAKSGAGARDRVDRRVLRSRPRHEACRRGRPGEPACRQQRHGARARHQRLRRRHASHPRT